MLISAAIPNLVNGVSQQPPTLRLASQAEEQLNFLSSVSVGLTKRPGSRHLAQLDSTAWTNAFIHSINRDTSERYIVVINNNAIRVFEAETGVERTVNAPDGLQYLSSSNKNDYRAVTVADYTFILNRDRRTKADTATTPERTNQALVHVRGGNYGKTYRVFIDGVERAAFTTPNGDQPAHATEVDTSYIAQELRAQLVAANLTNFTFARRGPLIIVTKSVSGGLSVRAEDGSGGTNIRAINRQVQRFTDLPDEALEGFSVEIVGDQSSSFDNYFVEYEIQGGTDGAGVWKEAMKGDEEYAFEAEDMPHVLVREANGTFTFKEATWAERTVGDLNKVPFPSFKGRKIKDIFFFRNRLGMVADENVVMSQDGEPFNFFRSTATTLLDTDPIDVAVTSDRVSILNHAVPFNRSLLLFSDQSQFILGSGDVLTPQTTHISQATAFESLVAVRPVAVGQYVYFPVPRGGYSGMREYFVQEGGEQNDAFDVTAHVPTYIPKGMYHLASSSSENTLVALTNENPNSLWLYRFFFNREGKLQSAWSEWRIADGDTILDVAFIESSMYLVVVRPDGTFLETINFEAGDIDLGSTVAFHLDRRVDHTALTSTFDGSKTTFTLPYETDADLSVVVLGGDATYPEGTIVPFTRPAPDKVAINGDWTASKLTIGQKFMSRYRFSTFYPRSQALGGGVTADVDGRIQLRYLSVDYANTGYFRLVSKPVGRSESGKVFSGRAIGTGSGTIGNISLSTGRFRIPVMCRNLDADIWIETDSPLPASFMSAEWEATIIRRARKSG